MVRLGMILPRQAEISWAQSYIIIFSVDLRYAGILPLWLAKNGHVTYISQ